VRSDLRQRRAIGASKTASSSGRPVNLRRMSQMIRTEPAAQQAQLAMVALELLGWA